MIKMLRFCVHCTVCLLRCNFRINTAAYCNKVLKIGKLEMDTVKNNKNQQNNSH
jgi:hypothetical protein